MFREEDFFLVEVPKWFASSSSFPLGSSGQGVPFLFLPGKKKEAERNHINEKMDLQLGTQFWAKLSGYPPWPARVGGWIQRDSLGLEAK
jgi:hypothetical protein